MAEKALLKSKLVPRAIDSPNKHINIPFIMMIIFISYQLSLYKIQISSMMKIVQWIILIGPALAPNPSKEPGNQQIGLGRQKGKEEQKHKDQQKVQRDQDQHPHGSSQIKKIKVSVSTKQRPKNDRRRDPSKSGQQRKGERKKNIQQHVQKDKLFADMMRKEEDGDSQFEDLFQESASERASNPVHQKYVIQLKTAFDQTVAMHSVVYKLLNSFPTKQSLMKLPRKVSFQDGKKLRKSLKQIKTGEQLARLQFSQLGSMIQRLQNLKEQIKNQGFTTLPTSKIKQIGDLREEASKLLGEVNFTIEGVKQAIQERKNIVEHRKDGSIRIPTVETLSQSQISEEKLFSSKIQALDSDPSHLFVLEPPKSTFMNSNKRRTIRKNDVGQAEKGTFEVLMQQQLQEAKKIELKEALEGTKKYKGDSDKK